MPTFLRTIFPKTCILCRKGASISGEPLCDDCRKAYLELRQDPCLFCGLPASECICPHNRSIRFLFWYDHRAARQLLAMLKYNAKYGKVDFLASQLAALCTERYDAVTFVPRRPSDVKLYGYDHAKLLAKRVAKYLQLPLIRTLQSRSFVEQKFLSAAQRERSMRGRYRALPYATEQYPHLLLVDDLCTTGATMRVCSSLLRKAGAKTVSCVTLAKVQNLYRN